MSDEKPFVVVLGRLTPIGERSPTASEAKKIRERSGVPLEDDGQPICETVKLERIVPDDSAS